MRSRFFSLSRSNAADEAVRPVLSSETCRCRRRSEHSKSALRCVCASVAFRLGGIQNMSAAEAAYFRSLFFSPPSPSGPQLFLEHTATAALEVVSTPPLLQTFSVAASLLACGITRYYCSSWSRGCLSGQCSRRPSTSAACLGSNATHDDDVIISPACFQQRPPLSFFQVCVCVCVFSSHEILLLPTLEGGKAAA